MLKEDGWAGITISHSSNITVQNIEIEGPALRITGPEASENRLWITGRDPESGCGLHSEASCSSQTGCGWNKGLSYCLGKIYSYYTGICLKVTQSTDLLIDSNVIHHCASAGVHCDQCDDVTMSNNTVYGTSWWTYGATSAIVFADAKGTGTNMMINNAIYENRNFLPYFST